MPLQNNEVLIHADVLSLVPYVKLIQQRIKHLESISDVKQKGITQIAASRYQRYQTEATGYKNIPGQYIQSGVHELKFPEELKVEASTKQLVWILQKRKCSTRTLDELIKGDLTETPELPVTVQERAFANYQSWNSPLLHLLIAISDYVGSSALRHQIEVMQKIKELLLDSDSDKSAIIATHDMNIAARFSDYIFLMDDGTIKAEGTPEEEL